MENPSPKTFRFSELMLANQLFLVPFVLFVILAAATIGIVGNVELFLWQNRFYSHFADQFFLKITHLGDAALAFAVVFILLRVSLRESLTFLLVTVLLMFLTTLLKRYIFPEIGRPVEYFEFQKVIRLAHGYYPPGLYSFPSGHSATAFSLFLYLSFLTQNKAIKLVLFLVALTVSYSRIYLSAHFPVDVVAGSFLGVTITFGAFYFSRRISNPWIGRKLVFRPKPSFR